MRDHLTGYLSMLVMVPRVACSVPNPTGVVKDELVGTRATWVASVSTGGLRPYWNSPSVVRRANLMRPVVL